MQEFIDGVAAMPLWAQIGMSLFVMAFLIMAIGPRLTRRKHAAALVRLAAAAGSPVTTRDEFAQWFTTTVEGRVFEVRHELRGRGGGGGYRGPTGSLLVTSTPLSGSRWELHEIDIMRAGGLAWLAGATVPSGDASFDERFIVRENGVPVREGWLDAPTRMAIGALFDLPTATGPVWVQTQRVQHLHTGPWRDLDLPTLTALLQRQAALATALECTGGWRGPLA